MRDQRVDPIEWEDLLCTLVLNVVEHVLVIA